jgi:cholesterol transport system auxiliary component
MKRIALTTAALVALSGCSLGLTQKPPPFLLNLVPTEAPMANDGQAVTADSAIVIAVPVVPQAIATGRVPVAQGNTAIAYIKDAMWVEPPARLFQRLLSETVRVKTGRAVLDARQAGSGAGLLTGQLLHFEIDESSNKAVVVYDATWNAGGKRGVLNRRFEARVPVGKIAAQEAGQALNRAANQVAGEVATWVSK